MKKLQYKDIGWSAAAQILSIGAGVFILPLILTMLSTEEIAMYYLMLAVGAGAALIDFGFTPQFGRNVSYVFSGCQELSVSGVYVSDRKSEINYKLLKDLIDAARITYKRLSFIILLVLGSVGSIYMNYATNNFEGIISGLWIWIMFSISAALNVYWSYVISLLIGSGSITKSKQSIVYSKVLYLGCSLVLLGLGWGLLGLVIANSLSALVTRILAYNWFYTGKLKSKLKQYDTDRENALKTYNIIRTNSLRLGYVYVSSFITGRFNIFIVGLYLDTATIASLGLMIQVFSVLIGVSSVVLHSSQPTLAYYNVTGQTKNLIGLFGSGLLSLYLIYVIGSSILIGLGPEIIEVIGSNASLPPTGIIAIYSLIMVFETNQSNFSTLIVIDNEVPFVMASIYTALAIAIGSLALMVCGIGSVLGLILVQGICQCVYNSWKWPSYVLNKYDVSLYNIYTNGYQYAKQHAM